MKLTYIQRKSSVSSILWILGCGLGMTHYPVKKVYAGFDLGDTVWLCRKSEGFLCGDRNTHLERLVKNFQSYIIQHPRHALVVKKLYLQRRKKWLPFIEDRLARYNYEQASRRVLEQDYRRLAAVYREVYPYAESLAIAIGNLSDKIRPEFLARGLKAEEFEKLILPSELSFIQKEQLDFLNIALSQSGVKITPATLKKLKRHQQSYTWLPYDYGVTSYSLAYFKKQLKTILKKGRPEIKRRRLALLEYTKNLKKEQGLISRKYRLNKRQLDLINVLRIAFFLVDSKKEFFTRLHWDAERLFRAISRQLNIPGQLLKYALPEEVIGFLRNQRSVDKVKLQKQYNNFFLKIKKDGTVNVKIGKAAQEIIDDFIVLRRQAASLGNFRGRPASPGTVRGLVRVIQDARECDIFKHGEILVTAMTSPDYMPAVRRAVAIITDEGGVTSHAAIISRELDIPCLVGTKNATQVLRTGDMVEVNADKGRVKIIKRYE